MGTFGIALFREVSVLCHVLLFISGNGPDSEVVDLFVDVVCDLAGVVTALRLENADGFALTLDGTALRIDGLDIFVVEDDGGRVFDVVGCVGLVGMKCPIAVRPETCQIFRPFPAYTH